MDVCEENGRLTAEYKMATETFSRSVAELLETMGISPKEEYDRLQRASEEWRIHSEQARLALEQRVGALSASREFRFSQREARGPSRAPWVIDSGEGAGSERASIAHRSRHVWFQPMSAMMLKAMWRYNFRETEIFGLAIRDK
jgi:hypothetical protein